MQPKSSFCTKISRFSITGLLLLVFLFSPVVQAVPYAKAGGADGRATLGMQIAQQAKLAASAVANTATAASTAATAGTNFQVFTKEFILDGLAWSLAKRMVSQMTQSMVNWINSGFSGQPAFITDLDKFLIDALDETAGQFISSLVGDFICSPFQLDVQFALEYNYVQAQSGMPSACRLSDIQGNIENFLGGFNEGGLDNWLTITGNPQNTPYGAYLGAEAKLSARLRNAAGKEIEYAAWGSGFLSNRVCQAIEGSSAEDCTITTPGRVVSEALTFQLSTGPRSLIEADEFNEIIVALINQISLQAMQGVGGLLGLTGGTGFTDSSGFSTPYLDRAIAEEEAAFDAIRNSTVVQDEIDRFNAVENQIVEGVNEAEAEADSRNRIQPVTIEQQITREEAFLRRINLVEREAETQQAASSGTDPDLAAIIAETTALRQQVEENLVQLEDMRTPTAGDEGGANLFNILGVRGENFFDDEFILEKTLEWDEALE